jgi:hypothetical protein
MIEYVVLIGIDRPDDRHDICLIESATGRPEDSALFHTARNIDGWALALRACFDGRSLAARLEQEFGNLTGFRLQLSVLS